MKHQFAEEMIPLGNVFQRAKKLTIFSLKNKIEVLPS